jgi:hypothetical protein
MGYTRDAWEWWFRCNPPCGHRAFSSTPARGDGDGGVGGMLAVLDGGVSAVGWI